MNSTWTLLLPFIFATFLQCSGLNNSSDPSFDCSVCKTPPVFSRSSYYHKVLTWPKAEDYFEPNPPILATLLQDYDGTILYRLDSTNVVLTDNQQIDPRMLIFTRRISPDEGNQIMIVDIIATRVGTELSSRAPLIIEFPPIPKPEFRKSRLS